MKRTPLTRRTPLTAKTPLKARSKLVSTGGLGKMGKSRTLYTKAHTPRSEARIASTDAYTFWMNAVWSRDKGECQAGPAGCSGGLDAHHIWPKGRYPERRLDVDNGVLLCRAHHNWAHAHPADARQKGLIGP